MSCQLLGAIVPGAHESSNYRYIPDILTIYINLFTKIFFLLDVDECSKQIHDCHPFGFCTNEIGSYNCTCKTGFQGDGMQCEGNTWNNLNCIHFFRGVEHHIVLRILFSSFCFKDWIR